MIVALCIGGYAAGGVAFALWDAYIGWGGEFEFNGNDTPPVIVGIAGWPIAIPLLVIYALVDGLSEVKKRRIRNREERIAKALVQTSEREKEEIRLSLEIAALDMELAEETKQLPSHKGKGKWITNTY